MAERVRITEVGPRDGLQNEPGIIPTEEKVRLVELCCATGVDEVEVTSFVSPRWVPQLGDAREVIQGIAEAILRGDADTPDALSVLVPNSQGFEALSRVNEGLPYDEENLESPLVNKVALFTAASETFSKKNTNATIAETIERFRPILERTDSEGTLVRGYVSCAIACPFEGPIDPRSVADVAEMLIGLGVDEIDLGDTIGAGTPETVGKLLRVMRDRLGSEWWGEDQITVHLHDTFGRAADCVRAALELGIRSFDGSVAGLGGCPYASTPGKRAPGNISTETLVRTVHAAGYETGVDLDRLGAAADYAREIVAKSRKGVDGGASA
jgi:hydroxymethylglutaryl-CoA lyase